MGGIGVVRLKGTIKWGCQDIVEKDCNVSSGYTDVNSEP